MGSSCLDAFAGWQQLSAPRLCKSRIEWSRGGKGYILHTPPPGKEGAGSANEMERRYFANFRFQRISSEFWAQHLCTHFQISSIKHDLARSCFQFWPKIGNEGDKISREKTGEASAETVFSRKSPILGHN